MTVPATKNAITVIALFLEDGNADKFPRAVIYNEAGTQIAVEDLSHVAEGHYTGTHAFSLNGNYFVVYTVYDDALRLVESFNYFKSQERYQVTDSGGDLNDLVHYSVKQAWTRNPPNMLGTVWLEKNGVRVDLISGDALVVTAKVGTALAYTAASVSPNIDGRYNVSAMYAPTPGTLVDIDATITTAEGSFKSQVSLSVPKLSP